MPLMASVNGRIMPLQEATVPVLDRGFLFGDALFEVMKVHKGRTIHVQEHIQRLLLAAKELRFKGLPDLDVLIKQVHLIQQQSALDTGYIYVQITRGAGRARSDQNYTGSFYIVFADDDPGPSKELIEQGVKCVTVLDDRALFGQYKTSSAMPRVISKFAAIDANAYEALYLHRDGRVFEATAANLFMVTGDSIITPPVGPHVLPGVTREKVIALAKEQGLKVLKRHIFYEELLSADEVFLTGSVKLILGVVDIDQHKINTGRPGPITKHLRQLYWNRYVDI